jgi:hypothetical protein
VKTYSWDRGSRIEKKLKQIVKLNYQSTQYLGIKLKNKLIKKRIWKNHPSQLELTDQTCDPGHGVEITS